MSTSLTSFFRSEYFSVCFAFTAGKQASLCTVIFLISEAFSLFPALKAFSIKHTPFDVVRSAGWRHQKNGRPLKCAEKNDWSCKDCSLSASLPLIVLLSDLSRRPSSPAQSGNLPKEGRNMQSNKINVIILQKRSLRIFGCTFFVNSSVNDCNDILSLCKGAHHSYVCSIVSSRIRAKAGKTADGVTCSIYLRTNRSARRRVLRGESHQTRVIDKVVLANHYSHSIFGLCPTFPPGVEELLSLEVRQGQTQSLSILFTEELWLQALMSLLVSIYIYYVSFQHSWLASGDLSSKVCKLVEAWAAMRHDVNRKTRGCFVNTSKILIASSCGNKAIT